MRRLAERLQLALAQANALAGQIAALARECCAPLTEICGISLLAAGALADILGPGCRFATDAQLAAYAGVAPLEVTSAERVRHRLNRSGNRRLNAILYRIALTQARSSPRAQAYLERRLREGKTRREAIRAFKRYLVRAVWRRWQECLCATAARPATLAARWATEGTRRRSPPRRSLRRSPSQATPGSLAARRWLCTWGLDIGVLMPLAAHHRG